MNEPATSLIRELEARVLQEGGMSAVPGGAFDVPATCWGIVALTVSRRAATRVTKWAERLAGMQLPDGCLPVDGRHINAYWPTPLLAIALSLMPGFADPRRRALDFLLRVSGACWKRRPDDAYGHDTSLPGWSWAAYTHSWVEPTAVAILALRANGLQGHTRVRQGVDLIMNRQLPSGGWNYGNTSVFGRTLFPTPESTAHALCAIQDATGREQVWRSVQYLRGELQSIRTPLTLAWGVMALAAWGERPPQADAWLNESLGLQTRYGIYDTTLLAQLLVASAAGTGFLDLICGGHRVEGRE